VRYDCPAVVKNRGRSIQAYRSALKPLVPLIVPSGAATAPPPPLYGHVRVTWAQLCRITEAFERIITHSSLDITRRLVCCSTLSALVRSSRLAKLEGRALSEFLEVVTQSTIDKITDAPLLRVPPLAMTRLTFRQMLLIYCREDRVGQHAPLAERLRAMMRMVAGKDTVPSLRPGFPAVRFDDLEQTFCTPTDDVARLFTRYYQLRLTSMGFFGNSFYQRPYLDGLNALLLMYPVTQWIARVYAVERDLDTPDVACVEQALQIMAHQHGMTPVLDIPTERLRMRYLCERSNLRSLIVWYGS
jgi:hypothetical protein